MIERTADHEYVRSIATHKRVWRWISEEEDDPGLFSPDFSRTIYLRVDGGYLSFRPFSRSCWEIHICLLPKTERAKDKAMAAMGWMHDRGVSSFLAKMPEHNRAAIALARKIGFKDCGRISACIHRGGMRDLVLMEYVWN